jgi:acetolactate synthase-1/2/3 large subunit
MTGREVVEALRPIVADSPDAPIFLVDGGNIGQWVHQALADRYPGSWLTCGASGVVGWGLGGAIGARLARPDRPVLLVIGDGAIGFNIAELETAVRLGTPFVAVLADDRAWGIVLTGQLERFGREGVIASELAPVAYDKVAEGFGAVGVRVESRDALAAAVKEALASGKTTLIHVPIAPGGPTD